MEQIFGKTNQEVKLQEYTGGATDTAEVTIADSTIYVTAHLSSNETESQIQEYINDNLNKSDSAVSKQFVTAVSETAGVISTSRRALVQSDIPSIEESQVVGLQSDLGNIKQDILGKQDNLIFAGAYSSTNPVATQQFVEANANKYGHYIGYSSVDPTDKTRSDYPNIIVSGETIVPTIKDFCKYGESIFYVFNGVDWSVLINTVVHTTGGDITNADIQAGANIAQSKISGLRTSDGTGALDKVDILVANEDTAGSVAYRISEAVNSLNKSDSTVPNEFIVSVSESAGIISVIRRSLTESDIPTLQMSKIANLQTYLSTINTNVSSLNTKLVSEASVRQAADTAEATARANAISALSMSEVEFEIGDGRKEGSTSAGEVIWKISQSAGKLYVSKTRLTADDIPQIPYTKIYNYKDLVADWNQTDSTAVNFIKNKPIYLSSFANNMGFITNAVDNLVNYYSKSLVYTKDEVEAKISAIPKFTIVVVDVLPELSEASLTSMYLLHTESAGSDVYTQYICVEDASEAAGRKWVNLGKQEIDLSAYLKKTDIANWAKQPTKPTYTAVEVGALPDTTVIPSALSELSSDEEHRVVTDSDKAIWSNKQDAISDIDTIRSNSNTAIQPEQLTSMKREGSESSGYTYTETDPTVPDWAKAQVPSFDANTLTGWQTINVGSAGVADSVNSTYWTDDRQYVTKAQIASWDAKSDFDEDYDGLSNRPSINNKVLTGNKSLTDLGIVNNIQSDWDATSGSAQILNKPDNDQFGRVDDVVVNGNSVIAKSSSTGKYIASVAVPTALAGLTTDDDNQRVSVSEKSTWNSKFTLPTGAKDGQALIYKNNAVVWDTVSQNAPVQSVTVNDVSVVSSGVANIVVDETVDSNSPTSNNAVSSKAVYPYLVDTADASATLSLGAIQKGYKLTGKSAVTILNDLLGGYVAPSVSNQEITFEYGNPRTLNTLSINYTQGTSTVTSCMVGTESYASAYYSGTAPVSGESITLSTPISLNGKDSLVVYVRLGDSSGKTTIYTITYSFSLGVYYCLDTDATSKPAIADLIYSATGVATVSYQANEYLKFFSIDNTRVLSQTVLNAVCPVDQTVSDAFTLTLKDGVSTATYYMYVSDKFSSANTCEYQLV